ncbi:hypothetical protein FHR32_002118 [Streptosporangium album]|uniref:Uncharacterized protein n=1 Tax=Streptosporangium album TaxID=47479 RepID=A0A7W7W8D5_9ACTN|nr:hypothetical protein [Streptosporangium album]MBB4937813.1 hypothetical protein [Streptosporangium album]
MTMTTAHQWQAATTLPVNNEQIQDMLVSAARGETPGFELPADTEIDVITVSCGKCMRLFEDAKDEPCVPVPMP